MTTSKLSPSASGSPAHAEPPATVGNFVDRKIQRLQHAYVRRDAKALAALARLRRAMNTDPGADPTVWEYTLGGYQVIKLDARTADEVQSAEKVHDKIADAIYDGKRQVELRRYLLKLRAQAIIEWKNDDVKKAYQEGLSQQAKEAATAPPAI